MTKNRKILYGAASFAIVGLMLVWAFAPRPLQVELAMATLGRFEMSIDEDARTRVRDRYVVSAPLAGRLARIALREGDAVVADSVVATLTPVLSPMLDTRTLQELSARVETADAMVTRAETRIASAQVALEQARNQLQRSEPLAVKGFVSATQLDAERLALRAAQKEQDSAREERHVAIHELDQAKAALMAVRQSTQGVRARSKGAPAGTNNDVTFEVRAPVAGSVLRVLQPSETTLALGTPLLEIGDVRNMEIVAELLTTDALQAKPGTEVRIERWGGPAELQGRVRRVEPAAFTKISALGVEEQRVNVLIDLTSPPEQWQAPARTFHTDPTAAADTLAAERCAPSCELDVVSATPSLPITPRTAPQRRLDALATDQYEMSGLGDGYRVSVRIIALAEDNVLRVPVSAVFPSSNSDRLDAMSAFVLRDGRAHLVPIEVGARNGVDAWIKSGLNPGDQVIIYPGNAVRDGVRVAARSVRDSR